MKRLFFILVCSTFFHLLANGQHTESIQTNNTTHTYLTARYHWGLVIPHHKNMMYFLEDFSSGFEINYGRSRFGGDTWERFFNYPEIGIGFYHGTFGNKEVYGTGYAVFPYINYKVVRTPKLSVQNKVSMGLGYATKPFSIDNNTYNTVFSSHLNVYIGFGLLLDYRIADHFSLAATASLTHFSNGAARKPNHGINTLTASIGTKYHFNSALTPTVYKAKPEKSNEREILIVAAAGRSQSAPFNPELYWNWSLSINHLWYLNEKRAVGIGLDQFYSKAAPYMWEAYEDYDDDASFSTKDYLYNGIFGSYNVFLGKTTLFVNLGAYFGYSIKPPQPIYPRLGIRHRITKNLVGNFSVKASFFRSEFLEFGLGYRFNYNRKKS